VPNAYEAFGKHVQQEAAQKLIERQSQQLLFVVVSRVAPANSTLALSQRDQAMCEGGAYFPAGSNLLSRRLEPIFLEYVLRLRSGKKIQETLCLV
jgi:hypothetical protein